MNTNIKVNVANKIATVLDAPAIVCGNSDYSITFTFDEEWEVVDFKTARFVYKNGVNLQFIDVVFNGDTVAVPIFSSIEEVFVGVYAGELRTTTPTRIICLKSILCDDPEAHADPTPDVYAQIIELVNNMETLPSVNAGQAGKALMVNEDGRWVVRLPDFMHDQNTGALIRFFYGTQAEWDAWTGDKTNVLFVPTDDPMPATIKQLIDTVNGLLNGEATAAKAKDAEKADNAKKVNNIEFEMGDSLTADSYTVPLRRTLWAGSEYKDGAGSLSIDTTFDLDGRKLEIAFVAKGARNSGYLTRFVTVSPRLGIEGFFTEVLYLDDTLRLSLFMDEATPTVMEFIAYSVVGADISTNSFRVSAITEIKD